MIYSVTAITEYIKRSFMLDQILREVSIRGEVTDYCHHRSGHLYFTLKDGRGTISCIMFRSQVQEEILGYMKNGVEIVATGALTIYEGRSQYQLQVKAIDMAGVGAQWAQYEELKRRLQAEGLFDEAHKKAICKYPRAVGIITSVGGAAIRDIIRVAHDRNPYIQLYVYPSKSQGQGTAQGIIEGIAYFEAMGVDTIILTRGGGSLEDFHAFNEEALVRAVYAAKIPIVAGIGHEINISLVDMAADRCEATPSAACAAAIPEFAVLEREWNHLSMRLEQGINNKLMLKKEILGRREAQIQAMNPLLKVQRQKQRLSYSTQRMQQLIERHLQETRKRQEILLQRLHGDSPTAKLIGGYGYLTVQGKGVQSVSQVKAGDELKVTIHDGTLITQVIETKQED